MKLALLTAAAAFVTLLGGSRQAAPAYAADAVLLAAGDIASCASTGDEQTADLVDTLAGTIAVAGDIAYENGSATDFDNCYDTSWGRHKARTKPAPGNHEYNTPGATGYYNYFGAAAGDPAKGYYSYDLGDWHIIALNSNCSAIGGCGAGSAQEQWLRADLVAHPNTCALAYWHHPRFSSGSHGNTTAMQPIWQALYDYHAEIVLSGHDHTYERFALQDAAGNLDLNGMREFVVGTGGRSHYTFGAAKPNSEVREGNTYGVLQLDLHASSYEWSFKPVAGATFTDSGSGTCIAGSAFDPDYDGFGDASADNCPGLANASQSNADRDVIDLSPPKAFDDLTWPSSDTSGDACDSDDDYDGISDADEASGAGCGGTVTDPLLRDTDGDRLLDGAECTMVPPTDPTVVQPSAPPNCLAADDADLDKVLDAREFCYYGSSPLSANSDGDACGDAREVASVNGDLTVSALDLSQIAQHFGPYTVPNAAHILDFDVTKDGNINAMDLGQVAQRFGACP